MKKFSSSEFREFAHCAAIDLHGITIPIFLIVSVSQPVPELNEKHTTGSFKHEIEWDAPTQEWVCVRCFRSSDHMDKEDAERELGQFECIRVAEPD